MRNYCDISHIATTDQSYRKVLWICLIINAVMFMVEMASGMAAQSVSLQGDALDFLGDSANYLIALYVLAKSLNVRASSSLIKAASLALFSVFVLGQSVHRIFVLELPTVEVMGVVGFIALIANVACAAILYRHRGGDSNRQSVWLCSRNDAIGNIAIMLAAAAVHMTGSIWPDIIVAVILALLALSASYRITRSALTELRKSQ